MNKESNYSEMELPALGATPMFPEAAVDVVERFEMQTDGLFAALAKVACPYSWNWRATVRRDGSVQVTLAERNVVTSERLIATVAVFSPDQIISELRTNWRRPPFAHVQAEGSLRRQTDALRRDLSGLLAEEYRALLQEHKTERVILPPEGLLRQEIASGLFGTTVKTVRTGRFPLTVSTVAWGLALLACLEQANQYDLPYGGRVFDVATLIRTATREADED